jgi:4-hydroxythreonine-4-phosphate dehydrogenase
MAKLLKIGITMGDPSGIGPEIIAKALPAITSFGQIVIIGDSWVFNRACRNIRIPGGLSFDFVEMANVKRSNFAFGKTTREYGRASMEYVDEALDLLGKGYIDCLVTCPVSKEAVSLARGTFRGHTEYLAQKAGVSRTVMMLLNDRVKFSLVTTHIPLRDVSTRLTVNNIRETALMTALTLKRWFGIARPSLAVAGCNPHASDNGVIGTEEKKIIVPAVKAIRAKGIHVSGPLPADSCCARALAKEFDAVIVMYHDQALIPLKITDPASGVNLTCGLPYVRSSPLHGTAFDIAGGGRASAASLIAAVETACRCAQRPKKASVRTS